jgi:hypothetical protein
MPALTIYQMQFCDWQYKVFLIKALGQYQQNYDDQENPSLRKSPYK